MWLYDRGTTLRADILSTSTTLELELQLCFVSLPNKIRISPFCSHSLLDHLNYFLLIAQVRLMLLAKVAYQMCRAYHHLSGFLCLALSIWARNLRDRAAFQDNLQASFLAVCRSALAIVAASQWPRELRLLKSCVNTRVAQVRKDISQVRTSITVFSQATSGSLGAVEVTATDTGISLWLWDDGTILISVCLCIIDISIPDLTLKTFECRLFAMCSFPSTCSHLCGFLFICVRGELRSHFQLNHSV